MTRATAKHSLGRGQWAVRVGECGRAGGQSEKKRKGGVAVAEEKGESELNIADLEI